MEVSIITKDHYIYDECINDAFNKHNLLLIKWFATINREWFTQCIEYCILYETELLFDKDFKILTYIHSLNINVYSLRLVKYVVEYKDLNCLKIIFSLFNYNFIEFDVYKEICYISVENKKYEIIEWLYEHNDVHCDNYDSEKLECDCKYYLNKCIVKHHDDDDDDDNDNIYLYNFWYSLIHNKLKFIFVQKCLERGIKYKKEKMLEWVFNNIILTNSDSIDEEYDEYSDLSINSKNEILDKIVVWLNNHEHDLYFDNQYNSTNFINIYFNNSNYKRICHFERAYEDRHNGEYKCECKYYLNYYIFTKCNLNFNKYWYLIINDELKTIFIQECLIYCIENKNEKMFEWIYEDILCKTSNKIVNNVFEYILSNIEHMCSLSTIYDVLHKNIMSDSDEEKKYLDEIESLQTIDTVDKIDFINSKFYSENKFNKYMFGLIVTEIYYMLYKNSDNYKEEINKENDNRERIYINAYNRYHIKIFETSIIKWLLDLPFVDKKHIGTLFYKLCFQQHKYSHSEFDFYFAKWIYNTCELTDNSNLEDLIHKAINDYPLFTGWLDMEN